MTRNHRIRTLVLALGLGLAATATTVASAQTIGYNTRTGDVWVDSRLGEINDYGRQYREPFMDEMTGHYGAPRPLLVELLDQRRWDPGDVYYACALAHSLRIPCRDVVREYDRHPGQGWGATAQRLGIKPGSPAFHALKRGQVDTYGRWGHPIVIDRDVRVDWSRPDRRGGKAAHDRPGRGHAAHAAPGKGQGASQGRGNGNGRANGSGGNDKGRGNGNNGNGNGNGKGRGKP